MLPGRAVPGARRRGRRHDEAGQYGRRRFLRHPAACATAASSSRSGDVSGKGSPAALLMALLLAMFRTLVPSIEEENLEVVGPRRAAERAGIAPRAGQPLHHAVLRHLHAADRRAALRQRRTHAPARAQSGRRRHRSPRRRRHRARHVRRSRPTRTGRALLAPGDLLAVYSDGITEAENPDGKPFDERGLETALPRDPSASASDLAKGVVRAVEQLRGRRPARRRSHDPSASPIDRGSGLI